MAKAEGWAVVQGDGPGGVAKSNFLEPRLKGVANGHGA